MPAIRWCRYDQISANTTSLTSQPGTKPMPATKALVNDSYEISDVRLTSNNQMTKGSSPNINAPLSRCSIDTQPAAGSLYFIASIRRMVPGLGLVISGMGCSKPGETVRVYCNAAAARV